MRSHGKSLLLSAAIGVTALNFYEGTITSYGVSSASGVHWIVIDGRRRNLRDNEAPWEMQKGDWVRLACTSSAAIVTGKQ